MRGELSEKVSSIYKYNNLRKKKKKSRNNNTYFKLIQMQDDKHSIQIIPNSEQQ